MKICAVISEYNPFHNGHRYLLDQIRSTGAFDAVLCLMSGNFCQRGEAAVLDKYTRATHALLGGADAVIELPAVFATGSAEIFARGAIRLLSAIPSVKAIAFGCERGTKNLFLETARATLVETEAFRSHLQTYLAEGIGYAAARERAWLALGVDTTLFASPNDILGLEYTKAILKEGSPIDILPIRRIGDGYNDTTPSGTFASASAIRAHRREEALLDRYVPPFVKNDLLSARAGFFPFACRLALEETSRERLRSIDDCTEGLDALLKNGPIDYEELVSYAAGKRYTAARIRRILTRNLLKISSDLTKRASREPLYLKPLAVRKNDALFSELSLAAIPVLWKGRQAASLPAAAKEVLERDEYADRIYAVCMKQKISQKNFKIL